MATVGCAGILVADMFCGPLLELPRAGQLATVTAMPVSAGGCAANVAVDLATQGVDVQILGCLGRDSDGLMLQRLLESRGVRCDRLIWVDGQTTSKTVILLVEGQDRRYLHMIGANGTFSAAQIDRDWLASLDVFYLGGLFAMPGLMLDQLAELLNFCQTNQVITVVDVVIPEGQAETRSLQALLPHIDYFIPNDKEAAQITGYSTPVDQIRRLEGMGANTIIITRGCFGAIAVRNGTYWEIGCYDISAVDPSGAGDAFASGLIVGILRQWELPQMLRYASAVGGSAVRAVGTTTSVFNETEATEFVESIPIKISSGFVDRNCRQ